MGGLDKVGDGHTYLRRREYSAALALLNEKRGREAA